MKQENKILMDELFVKYLTGSATLQEREDALAWIHESEKNEKYFDELKDYYEASILAKPISQIQKEESWARIKDGYYKTKYSGNSQLDKKITLAKTIKYALPIAASLLLAFFLGTLLQKSKNVSTLNKEDVFTEFVVPRGSRSQIILPDKTKVWLNSDSKLKYQKNFNLNKRVVFLEGEGFFDVAHDSSKQFIVNTSDIKIKVYGTKFNVKSYPKENIIETTLEEGSISMIENKKGSDELFLKPNESIIFQKKTNLTEEKQNNSQKKLDSGEFKPIQRINPLDNISWKDNKLVFNEIRIEDMVNELERWYNINIEIADENIKKIKFTATFTTETTEQVLRAICMAAKIDYEIDKDRVILKTKR